jgi:hypothetical protein
MALTDKNEIQITMEDNGFISWRKTRVIYDGLERVGERHVRGGAEPGEDLTNQPPRVKKVAEAVWTAQLIADYRAEKAKRLAEAAITP